MNWQPSTCKCTFSFNPDGSLLGANKCVEQGHDQMNDSDAFQAAKELNMFQPTPVPDTVKPLALRLALLEINLLDTVEAAIAQSERPIQIAYEYAIDFSRDHPMIASVAQGLGLSSDQLDAIFKRARYYESA